MQELPNYNLRISKRSKKISLKIDRRGLTIVSPYKLSEQNIQHILQKNWQWLQKHRQQIENAQQEKYHPDDKLQFCGVEYLLKVRVGGLSSQNKVMVNEDAKEIIVSKGQATSLTEVVEQELRKRAKKYLRERGEALAKQYGFTINRIFIKDNVTNWGSCSSKGNINLSWRLALAPLYVSDYVIIHELAHTKVMNHSVAFWELVERYAPHYLKAKQWLQQEGNRI